MKRLFTISGIFMLFLLSQNTFAQEKQSGDKIDYKSDEVKHNTKEKTIILQGNVVLKTKNISLENAERVTIDEKNNTVTIYNPKDFKILYAKTVSKTDGSNKNIIVYNTKDESIIFQ
ncbi:hypothetical protein AB670_03929 [Chryseobacterium sp. MOF25P]|uniref:LptA/OstA family protein n=1 Tax=unclassified Chryseobacterium TaxID=2593645 RepID=UPI00080529FC|nr:MULTISPECIES: LptA/OstA family protein [unclassified Chryseobacterium]OBW39731.1 hypothetical protein AB670_03929 [Chryseobacterium sp. MOF25P]OBW46006.1 hypothetical protein AB671_01909 [Chryseobacterium sp. BGARF1]